MYKLGAHGIDDKVKGDKHGICSVLLLEWQRPETFIVGIKVSAMNHGIDRVDTLKVLAEQEVGLYFVGYDADDLGEPALAGPVVGKGMLGA